MRPDIKEGSKVRRASGRLQGMACHSGGQVGVEIADVLETYASFRELILQGSQEKRYTVHYAKGHTAQSDLFWRLHQNAAALCYLLFKNINAQQKVELESKQYLASISLRDSWVMYTSLISLLLRLTAVNLGPCAEIHSSAFEVSVTGALVTCAV